MKKEQCHLLPDALLKELLQRRQRAARFRALYIATLGLTVVGLLTLPQVGQTAVRQGQSWDDGRVTVKSVCFRGLPDGGAAARIDALAALADGGSGGPDNAVFIDLAGSARTTALNALSNAQTAWVNAQP